MTNTDSARFVLAPIGPGSAFATEAHHELDAIATQCQCGETHRRQGRVGRERLGRLFACRNGLLSADGGWCRHCPSFAGSVGTSAAWEAMIGYNRTPSSGGR